MSFHHNHCGKLAVIKNPSSGMVLDGTDKHVKLQHYTGFPSQLWKLEDAGAGRFFIVNKSTGKVLDIQQGAAQGNNLITYQKHGGVNQQWILNSDGTIVCIAGNLAVDIKHGECKIGTSLIAWPKHGGNNQKFALEYC